MRVCCLSWAKARTLAVPTEPDDVIAQLGDRCTALWCRSSGRPGQWEETLEMENQKTGPKFEVNIEGQLYPWNRDTITVPEIRGLGGLPENVPVIEVDLRDNTERTLAEDEVVELKPGKGFGKKVTFQRG